MLSLTSSYKDPRFNRELHEVPWPPMGTPGHAECSHVSRLKLVRGEAGASTQTEVAPARMAVAILAKLEAAARVAELQERIAKLKKEIAELQSRQPLVVEGDRASWDQFLQSLSELPDFPVEQGSRVEKFWRALEGRFGTLPLPQAQANEDGDFSMAWDREQHHVEILFHPAGRVDWFYTDLDADTFEGQEDVRVKSISRRFHSLLALVAEKGGPTSKAG